MDIFFGIDATFNALPFTDGSPIRMDTITTSQIILFGLSLFATILTTWLIPSILQLIIRDCIGFEQRVNKANLKNVIESQSQIWDNYIYNDFTNPEKPRVFEFVSDEHKAFSRQFNSIVGYMRTSFCLLFYLLLRFVILLVGLTYSYNLIGLSFFGVLYSLGIATFIILLNAPAFFQNFSAYVYLVTSNHFKRGDTIGISGLYGVIWEFNMMYTTLVVYNQEQFAQPFIANQPNHIISQKYRKIRPKVMEVSICNNKFLSEPVYIFDRP